MKNKNHAFGKARTIKFRAVNRDIFQAIEEGIKKFETRAATQKCRTVKAGDMLMLVCGNKRMVKEVRKAEHFKIIDALLKKYTPESINPRAHSAEEARDIWYSFPGYREKIKKFGLVLWKI